MKSKKYSSKIKFRLELSKIIIRNLELRKSINIGESNN